MAYFFAQNRRGAKKNVLAYFGRKIGVFLENLDRWSGILADRGSEILPIGGPKFWVPFTYAQAEIARKLSGQS